MNTEVTLSPPEADGPLLTPHTFIGPTPGGRATGCWAGVEGPQLRHWLQVTLGESLFLFGRCFLNTKQKPGLGW